MGSVFPNAILGKRPTMGTLMHKNVKMHEKLGSKGISPRDGGCDCNFLVRGGGGPITNSKRIRG